MLESKYSAPDLDLYGDRETSDPTGPWPAPRSTAPVRAALRIPGSKSLTNRELLLAALADGPGLLRAPLHSEDSRAMIEALRALGVTIDEVPGDGGFGPDLRVTPPEELFGSTTIDCAQAGTVMRFAPALAALALGPVTFDAHESARHRPMSVLVDALRELGADINDDGRGTLPFTVHGRGSLAGGEVTIDASSSSQFVSALLLVGARLENGLVLRHAGERLPSMPHIAMTIDALAARGVVVESPETGVWTVAPQTIRARDIDIEPDLSNAGPFLAAAVATGGSVTITGWPAATTQVGDHLIELLPAFGARVERSADAVTVHGPETISAVTLDLTVGGELAPPLIALAALADGPSEITGIGHIRLHETDRLAALTTEINALGGQVEELEDGLRITPAPLHGGIWHSYHDHRMSTAGAILGLVTDDLFIENVQATAKTLPEFPELWTRMVRG